MWTPSIMWNHPADGFEHEKLKHVSNCEAKSKIYEIDEIIVGKVLN